MKISVNTVYYNSAATIVDAVQPVASQTHPDIEHSVIDGRSTDGTVQVVEAHRYPDLVPTSEPDYWIYDARNKGVRLSSGEVIGFLRSVDVCADKEVRSRVAEAFEDAAVEVCFRDLVYVTADSKRAARYWKSRSYESAIFARG